MRAAPAHASHTEKHTFIPQQVLDAERNARTAAERERSALAEREEVEAVLAERKQRLRELQAAVDKAAVERRQLEGELREAVRRGGGGGVAGLWVLQVGLLECCRGPGAKWLWLVHSCLGGAGTRCGLLPASPG